MRWLGLAALVLMATGCTVHVVERPALPVLLTVPAQSPDGVYAGAARPARPMLPPPHARPAQTRPPAHARPAQPSPVAAPQRAVPTEPRPKRLASVRAPAPHHPTPPKRKRSGRFKLEPNDVLPIENEPARPARQTPPRSASVAKAQKHAFDLRQ
jgi:hypothetical protein